MITGISVTGKYLLANGGYSSSPYVNMNNISAGMVRYNGNNSQLEVYDGSVWVTFSTTVASVGLNSEAESLLDWAKKKRDEEESYIKLAKENKAVEIALDHFKQAQRHLEITTKLVKEHEQTTS